jgi:hypothetical protein
MMSKENILIKAKVYYAEDFIECYDKWKATLDEANIEIFYDDIIPKDKIFLFNKPDSHNIGIKIYRSDIYYYVFENKINDAIKLIEIK